MVSMVFRQLMKFPICELPVEFYERERRSVTNVSLSDGRDHHVESLRLETSYHTKPEEMLSIQPGLVGQDVTKVNRRLTSQGIGIRKRLDRLGRPPAGIVVIVDSVPADFEITGNVIRVTPGYTRTNVEYRLYVKDKK